MWDTVSDVHTDTDHLSHDRPCPWCGHASHRFLPCDAGCGCTLNEADRVELGS